MIEQIVDVANTIARVGAHFFIQSAALIAIAFVVARFAARTAAVRSAIYRATLVAVIALPAVAWVGSRAGVSFVSVPFPEARLVAARATGITPSWSYSTTTAGTVSTP